ncbi:MAG: efflux RND transporter periplasmic adaptor subunit [Bacteroidales bacterium]
MSTNNNTRKNLLIALTALLGAIIVVVIIGWVVARPEPVILQGEADASEYRISSKVPGHIEVYLCKEGDQIKEGDTLALIESPELQAKLAQAEAAKAAAEAQNKKAINGARKEQIAGAYEQWQKAKVGEEIMRKSYERIQTLYKKEVISAQRRDEVKAKYDAAKATTKMAKSQYDMATSGARSEDKAAALALVARAEGAISEVNSYIKETTVTAPVSGEICETFHKKGEIVGSGSPLLSIVDMNDIWLVFNIREDLLSNITMGSILEVNIPALSKTKIYKAKVTYIKAMASYATWRATKVNGQFDAKTFEVKAYPVDKIENLRPGMSAVIKNVDIN